MRSYITTTLAILTSLAIPSVHAQDLSGVPSCAIPCFVAALPGSGCGLTDTTCQCTTGRQAIQNSILSCAPAKCGESDVAKLAPAVLNLCAQAGITISNVPTAAATSSGSAAATLAAKSVFSVTRTASRSESATGTGAPAATTNAAVGNISRLGVVALGVAAGIFGL